MKIADSALQLFSQHTALEKNEKKESLTVWKNGQDRRTISDNDGEERELNSLRRKAVAQSSRVSLSAGVHHKRSVQQKNDPEPEKGEVMKDLNLRVLRALIERLTGRKIEVTDPGSLKTGNVPVEQQTGGNSQPEPAGQQGTPQPQNSGFGLVYEYHQSHYESESTSFTAQGIVHTADGQEINFSTQLNLSREFYSEENQTIRLGEALKDPLVVNFSGTAAELTQTHFSFDLNSDGTNEQIAFISPGSGFLALDRNGDNIINNGT